MSFFSKLTAGLSKTRKGFKNSLGAIFHGKIDEEFYEELEEALILADIGVETSMSLCENLRQRAKAEKLKEREQLWQALQEEIARVLAAKGEGGIVLDEDKLNILVLIGVNGAGKTTTAGKLAAAYTQEGRKVIMAAADTFRAAAAEQLAAWAQRSGADLVRQGEGADPGAVVFDAIAAAKSRKAQVLLIDTAGRLQNKSNLMAELAKIGRVIQREAPDAVCQNILVLDGNTGSNMISQARQFGETLPLTGLILTKLDGTAKGGAVIGVVDGSGVPVQMIGVGEGIEDLRPFVPADFAAALFEEE
ncbi:MAG: signal recognition particle-docking protein FtsY [Firmicutes bacterium]|nr:signal recognition particle-docking protein FtsY [Bacillota bacterium]